MDIANYVCFTNVVLLLNIIYSTRKNVVTVGIFVNMPDVMSFSLEQAYAG